MAAFSEIEATAPPETIVVPVFAFADTWNEKPKTEVCMGLRLIAEKDLQIARSQAAELASTLHKPSEAKALEHIFQLWSDAYHDALIRWIVARGTCDPNDVGKDWEGWAAAPEDLTREALTADGAGMIFDRWERMRIATNPGILPLRDAELPDLIAALSTFATSGKLTALSGGRGTRLRRLLRFVFEEVTKEA